MERIFGKDTIYSGNTIEELKNVMRAEEQNIADCTVYGKTGTGKAHGVLADAWFIGFAETPEGNVYFCKIMPFIEMRLRQSCRPQTMNGETGEK